VSSFGTNGFVSSFDITHFSSKSNGSINKLPSPVETGGLPLNSYPALHLQVPVLVSFEYE
jgi:hypothetical protein